MQNHKTFMNRCLELAELSVQNGESPVGSVVVKDGKIIGEGTEQSKKLKDISRHAEVVAILNALKNTNSLEGSVLYTNVEPCILCSYVIRHHKFAEVVFAKHSGELGGTHLPFNVLNSDKIKSWSHPPKITIYRE